MNRKNLTLAALALCASFAVTAQTDATTTVIADEHVEAALVPELTAEQTEGVKASNARFVTAMQELHATTTDREVLATRTRELRVAHEGELKAIMTPAQFEQYNSTRRAKRNAGLQKREEVAPTSK